MTFWFTPFPLPSSLDAKLLSAGLRRHDGLLSSLPPGSLLLYSAPHEALEALRAHDPLVSGAQELLRGYEALLGDAASHGLVSTWRLQQLSSQAIASWVAERGPLCIAAEPWPRASPLTALVTSVLLRKVPACLDAYLRLEAQAERFGTEADSGYGSRLDTSVELCPLLEQWWLAEPKSDLTLLQLQQVEEELLTVFLANRHQLEVLAQARRQIRQLLGLLQRQFVLLSRGLLP